MKKTKTKTKLRQVKTTKTTPSIAVSLTVGGRNYTAKGKTALEAVQHLEPEVYRGVGILSFENQGIKREKILGMPLMNRLFGKVGHLQKEIALKQISLLIGL